MKPKYTRLVLTIVLALVLFLSACASAPATSVPTVAPTQAATHTPEPTATKTSTPTITPSPTATPNLIATQQYEAFVSRLQKYVDAKYISSTKGTYQSLGDHSLSLAKQGGYQTEMNGVDVKNFIVRSDVTLQAASRTSARSGCGFVFSRFEFKPLGDAQIMLFLGQNGTAYNVLSGYEFNSNHYNTIPNPAEVELTLIVDGVTAHLLVNDREMIKWAPLKDITTDWGFAVISGSNEDYGSKCDFKNIDYWVIEE